ncbi:BINDING PROTEIN putative-RELATED [Salix purpurea]|uniref:BINDING PROTEIN putative-RELATED n=1 Tax=Salix purpurea TaxID=77065 RepID=A0A9Q0VXJ1_SALPP|nr:BINDING PROTEIN putative-RELATED [Salix purpurea]
MRFHLVAAPVILAVLWALALVQSLDFQFPNFTEAARNQLILSSNSYIAEKAIQVTPDFNGASIANRSGRVLYKWPFRLWSKEGKKASFNTTFVLNIKNITPSSGEGLAFILTAYEDVPVGSEGQWLGIVNPTLNGSIEARTAAVEFDTRKSFPDDLDDNHIGLDVNSVYSRASVSLNGSNIYISSGKDIKVAVRYDGENLTVFVGEDMDNPVLSEHLSLSSYLPEAVYVGFSGSTSDNTQLNCVKSWEFIGSEIEDSKLRWVWILAAAGSVLILLIITGIGAVFLHRKRGCKVDRLDDAYPNIDEPVTQEATLSWEKRLSVISGVAHALDYLHNGCMKRVFHRDIKASNIMLDSDFNAKLGDFGLARTIIRNEQTHHSTKELAGTPGYMAPESILTGRATAETDVYAFGVLVLEVACGRKPRGQTERDDYISNIVHGLWELYRRGTILEGADARLDGIFKKEEMERVLILGLACCHPNPNDRPSMKTVLEVLTGEAPLPDVPAERPVFMWPPKPPSFKELDNSIIGDQLPPISELAGR